MIELLLAPPNTPFAVALGLMLLLAVLEIATTLFGASASSTVDSLLPEFDTPDLDVDVDVDVEIDVDVDGPEIDASAADGVSAAYRVFARPSKDLKPKGPDWASSFSSSARVR